MTHEAFRRRLEALEEARKLRDGPVPMRSIFFVNPDGTRASPTVARGPRNFECWRNAGEEEMEFESRARAECRATVQHPFHILVFHPD